MDVMKFVLYATTKLTLAVTGVGVALVVFVLKKLTGHIRTRAQQPTPQQELLPASTAPAVQVHVHLDQAPPPPMPVPARQQPPTSSVPPSPALILNRPDHRIYITTGSHLMLEHPACDDLLERLDEILYRAAYRDGEPFTVGPPLDEARHGRAVPLDLLPVAAVDEGEFFSEDKRDLPPPDGALWFRKAGNVPQRLPV